MKYVLLIYRDEMAGAKASPADMQKEGAAYEAFTKSIKDSGNFVQLTARARFRTGPISS